MLLDERHALSRDVDQSGLGAERHGVPVVRAERTGDAFPRLVLRARARRLDRPAVGVIAFGPRHLDEVLRRKETAVSPVDDVEESILGRVQQHLAQLSVDDKVGKDDVLRRRVVPTVAGRLLVMPDIFAGVRVQRDDRSEIEIVAAARAAFVPVPRAPVAGADIHQVQLRIERHGIPHRAAAAGNPVLAGRIPGPGGPFHGNILIRLRRIARDREPAPFPFPRVRVVGRDVTAHAVFGAAIADHHVAVVDARRSGDGVGLRAIDDRVLLPHPGARRRIDRHEPPVIRADEDLSLIERDAAVHDIAAAFVGVVARHLGVVGPDRLAGFRIERVHDAPGRGHIHHAADDDGCRFDAAARIQSI